MLVPLFLILLANLARAVVLSTSGRWIVNATGDRVKLRCAVWAGHLETRIPEGLQHQSADSIAGRLAERNFNCVRLTFSDEMVFEDVPVSFAFEKSATRAAIPPTQMIAIYRDVVDKNPALETSTTLGAFGVVIQALEKHGIMVILSNQASRASWCCSESDGNGWWQRHKLDPNIPGETEYANSRYFNPEYWMDGLETMANFSRAHPNVVGLALRSGLRAAGDQIQTQYEQWFSHIEHAAGVVAAANKDLLIVVGGVDYGTDLAFLWDRPLDRGALRNKLVYEFNHYQWSSGSGSCQDRKETLGKKTGFLLAQDQPYTAPLFLSEFGWTQNNPSLDELAYVDCLKEYMMDNDAEWAYWALQGSYYVRDGAVNQEEAYGLLNSDWSDWRNVSFHQVLGPMFNMTQGP